MVHRKYQKRSVTKWANAFTTVRAHKRNFRKVAGANTVHRFTRCEDASFDVIDNTNLLEHKVGDGVNNTFKLSVLPNASEFTTLFDAYRIDKVKLTFIYSSNDAVQGTSATNSLPMIGVVKDYDDATALTSVGDYEQYETYKLKRIDKPFSVVLRPRIAMSAYQGAFTGYINTSAKWIDANSPDVQHYGLKWFIWKPNPQSTGAKLGQLHIMVKYYLSFKLTR